MFATCLFCLRSLGANQRIEHFPIGRRLAFDADRGRLWAVCTKCGRWNLTPLEERWEAIEECERAYRAERRRVSTDHIGLARLNDGTDLVRIGQPLLPEFAAWRYGEQLRRRGKQFTSRFMLVNAGSLAVAMLPLLAGRAWFGVGIASMSAMQLTQLATTFYQASRPVGRIKLADGTIQPMNMRQVAASVIGATPEGEIDVKIHFGTRARTSAFKANDRLLHVSGPEARPLLRDVIHLFNYGGGSRLSVHEAVQTVQEVGDELALIKRYSAHRLQPERGRGAINNTSYYLALEMLLHEEDERRAMAGELGELYARWEDAERIAKIADGELTALPENPPTRS